MKLAALMFSVVGLTIMGVACAPPPPQGGGVGLPVQPVSTVCPTAEFLSKVHYLKIPFSPAPPYNISPQSDPAPINVVIRQDLTDAFTAAPDFFKNQLCGLDAIFIGPAGCGSLDPSTCTLSQLELFNNSWGFRSNTSPPHRYIAMSLGLWRNGHAPFYSDYRTKRLQTLLQRAAKKAVQKPPENANPPKYTLVDPNTSAMTVLAVLSHEFGHVLWFDTFVPKPGGPADTSQFCKDRGTFYLSGSWIYQVDVPPGRWVEFGEQLNGHVNNDVDIATLAKHWARGNFNDGGDLLHGILSGRLPNGYSRPDKGPWASTLAAFSPDEDFVETYEFFVLKSATPSLQHSALQIPGTHRNVFSDDIAATWRGKPELVRKMGCFGPLPRS